MWQQLVALLMIGLGLSKPAQQGMVAGLADLRSTTLENIRTDTRTLAPKIPGTAFTNTASSTGVVSRELEDRREKAKETFKKEREAFQKKVEVFRDQTKKERVASLSAKLDDVNLKRTNQMMIFLNKVVEVLTKVKIQTEAQKAKGKDVSKVTAAIAAAQSAIDAAKAAIETQAGKSYVISISSESNVRGDVGATMKSLQADASSVRDLVNAAKKRVSDAIRELAKVRGEAVVNRVEPTEGGATTGGVRR